MPDKMKDTGSARVAIQKPIRGMNADILHSDTRNDIAVTLLLHGYGVHHSE